MYEITTDEAPASIGPFSQGIRDQGRLYVSGQGPVDPDSGEILDSSIRAQTERTLENVDAVLEAGDCSFDDVVKASVYTRDITDYDVINEVYEEFVSPPYPARTAIEVSDFPLDIDVEIDVVATTEGVIE